MTAWKVMMLVGSVPEAAGAELLRVWRRYNRQGRLHYHLRQLERRGLLAHEGGYDLDQRVYRLTAAGQAMAHGPVDPPSRWQRPWDGQWRIVTFDIPESRKRLRHQLRRTLRLRGFGWLQNSVWISPDLPGDWAEIVRSFRANPDSLTVFQGTPVGSEGPASIVEAAWDFERLHRGYHDHAAILQLRPRGLASPAAIWRWLETERRAWLRLAAADPFLPEPLLPPDYPGRAAWRDRLEAIADTVRRLIRA